MAKKHKLYCAPKDGKFNWERQFDLQNLPGKLEKYGRVVVTFEKYVPMKSLNQMRYYRGGILPWMEKELGASTGEIITKNGFHELLKSQCGIIVELTDELSYTKSLADYTEAEMAAYITKVGLWVMDWFNATIPPPTVIEEYL